MAQNSSHTCCWYFNGGLEEFESARLTLPRLYITKEFVCFVNQVPFIPFPFQTPARNINLHKSERKDRAKNIWQSWHSSMQPLRAVLVPKCSHLKHWHFLVLVNLRCPTCHPFPGWNADKLCISQTVFFCLVVSFELLILFFYFFLYQTGQSK